jgi:RND family efflux transporter MFP subunit
LDPRDTLSALKLDREPEREPRNSSRLWVATCVALLLIGAGGAALWWGERPHVVVVRTITVASGAQPAGAALNASGYVIAQQEATVAAEITGMVTAVYVTEGDRVTAGQIIAQLDDRAYQATVKQARSQLEADRAVPPEYEAQLVRDRLAMERMQTLLKANAVSPTSVDQAVAAVGVDKSELAHAIGQIAVDEKALAYDETQLSYTVIRAPFIGVVTERYAHPGEMISPEAVGGFTQTGICKIVDMKSLEIDVDVNEAYVERVHAGQTVEALLDAYPDWTIPAHVIGVVPTANQQKATVKVRIAFDRLDPKILPQMGVQVRFLSAGAIVAAPVIRVPASALRHDSGGDYVFVVEGGRAARRAVTAHPGVKGATIVSRGLDGGERVVIAAQDTLKDGEEISEP